MSFAYLRLLTLFPPFHFDSNNSGFDETTVKSFNILSADIRIHQLINIFARIKGLFSSPSFNILILFNPIRINRGRDLLNETACDLNGSGRKNKSKTMKRSNIDKNWSLIWRHHDWSVQCCIYAGESDTA